MKAMRQWLEEKRANDVKQVRVTSVLAWLAAIEKRLAENDARRKRRAEAEANGKVTVEPGDLLGAFEVAEFLGVDRTRPSKWRHIGTKFGPDAVPFPEPFRELATGPVWLKSEIAPLAPFVEERRRRPRAAASV